MFPVRNRSRVARAHHVDDFRADADAPGQVKAQGGAEDAVADQRIVQEAGVSADHVEGRRVSGRLRGRWNGSRHEDGERQYAQQWDPSTRQGAKAD
jgi:hypothetical protein